MRSTNKETKRVMGEKGTVKDKSRLFAIDIINLYKRLSESKKEYVLSKLLTPHS